MHNTSGIGFRKRQKHPTQKLMNKMAVTTTSIGSAATKTYLQIQNEKSSMSLKWIIAIIYIISGATQPLLVTLVKISGLGDHTCQLYMLMYYLGPSCVSFTLCRPGAGTERKRVWSLSTVKASAIALIDVAAQTINYTGATWAGPTIFAIIYSSVTIWTAVYSRILMGRKLKIIQWFAIFIVFGGLAITATDSVSVGPDVFKGSIFVLVGSSFHAMTYVLSEGIMTDGEQFSPQMNCAIQGIVASIIYLWWQLVYTSKHLQERVIDPMEAAGTSLPKAIVVLMSLSLSNLAHALSFFYTLKNYPGGATSAGVMKGLQAVLVFIFTSIVYCGSTGGDEMCFSTIKLMSLVIVIGGVALFTAATDLNETRSGRVLTSGGHEYSPVGDAIDENTV